MRLCYSCMHPMEDRSLTVCPACGEPLELSCDTSRFLRPGTILQGKFVVGKVLGAGGFGNTYVGWNRLLQCKVAIKEYFPRQLSVRNSEDSTVSVSETASRQRFHAGLQQFLEEARGIAGLQEVKGIIQIYTFFEEYGTGYFVMEYLEGMDVKAILKRRGGRMDYEDSRRIILTVLHTLREIHKRGVLHRDIAPDNVYVTKEGVIKLIDFGAAKHASENADTQGEIMLKPGYAPPEQYSRQMRQGAYTDLYAAAALFYRLLTGKKPQAANERLKEDQVKPLSALGIRIPRQAEYAIMMCLKLEPRFRLQNAQDFMEALEGADFVPVYEPEWILPDVEERPETLSGRIWHRIKGWNVFAKAGLLAALLAVTVMGAAFGIRMQHSMTQKEQISGGMDSLPQCVGESEQDARKILESVSVENIEVVYRYDGEQKKPVVVNMDPPNGSSVEKGETVTLYVAGREQVTIPDYQGQKQEEIDDSLREILGEKYEEVADSLYQYNYWKQKKGSCHAQSVAGENLTIDNLSKLSIQISWGEKSGYMASMPNLRGRTLSQAESVIAAKGLKLQLEVRERTYSNRYAEGEIIWQSLAAGKRMNNNPEDEEQYKGDQVIRVTVSRGAKPEQETPSGNTSSSAGSTEKSTGSSHSNTSDTHSSNSQKSSGGGNDFNASGSGAGDDW